MSRRGPHDDTGGEPFHEGDLDARVCPTCGRDLPTWHSDCPVCREPAVLRFGFAGATLPAVPDHLRDAIDEPPDPGNDPGQPAEVARAAAADHEAAEGGAHKPDDDPFQEPSPTHAPAHPAPLIAPLWAAGGIGGAGGCGGDAGGAC